MKIETDLSKLTRWLIPGWGAILSFFVFVISDIFFRVNKSQLIGGDYIEWIQSDVQTAWVSLIVAASGIPLGFLIYQTYFFFRWNSPFSRDGLFFPLSQGRMNDFKKTKRDLTEFDLTKGGKSWRLNLTKDPLYERDHAFRWNFLEALCLEAFQNIDSKYEGLSLYSRHRYLHEVLHTLGVSIFASYFGLMGYLIVKFSFLKSIPAAHVIALIIPIFLLIILLNLEEEKKLQLEMDYLDDKDMSNDLDGGNIPTFIFFKGKGEKRKPFLSIISPGILFIMAFGFFHLFGNPVLNPSRSVFDISLRIVILLLISIVWITSRRGISPSVMLGNFLSVSLVILASIITLNYYHHLENMLDWSYLMVVFEFMVVMLILSKNRQNTTEEKAMLEYFTLRRYLTEKENGDVDEL